jgi:hypothetical protein
MAEFYNFQKHRRNGLPKVLQGETPTPPATQQMEIQGLVIGISSGQDVQENLEEIEALIKKAEEKPQSTSGKLATDTAGK